MSDEKKYTNACPVDSDSFYLDMRNMDAIIAKVQKIAKTMQETKAQYSKDLLDLTDDWKGQSRTMFDKKSAQLLQTLTDVSQSFYEIGEDLLTASQTYMEYDTQLAKSMDGKQERF